LYTEYEVRNTSKSSPWKLFVYPRSNFRVQIG
jgi:hypothetical protein